ncbi:tagaturonate reductase [Hyunsoonleella pacifica]|uniref:Tagaturonate reductase n=1 Tax=Hyunsoonleella pacifica TaxID=1080224 RepID=A0A4Q9FSI0_9FLAO|nr:tagaturonate reductase [Hyunsoonleella pacifica]TBN18917.1 tagaturonate reductase [Hyunsoonleella pacifica]GGD05860.1 altronate oxidoreductase [Hyunsoonleella pacifica]
MRLNRKNQGLENKNPIKIVQFGEGNFLRAFVDYAIYELNKKANFNAGIAVIQPIDKGVIDMLNDQDGLYTLFTKGVKKGKIIEEQKLIDTIVTSVNPYEDFNKYISFAREESLEFVISNTTEAGIVYVSRDTQDMKPPSSFPAKLTCFLYERYNWFNGDKDKGLTIIPCELINYNSDTLKDIILKYISDWNLENDFKNWVLEHNSFHNTLVDRIVPGYPRDDIEAYNAQLNYSDKLIVSAETFLLWVIEGGEKLKKQLPFDKTDLDVKIVEDMQPYRTRKVRILNGAHTSMVPFSLLYGNETVKESVDNEFTGKFIQDLVFNEVIDTLNMEKSELNSFANEVFDRFKNPFIVHKLASIALNSISKFKVRVLPSLIEYIKIHDKLPTNLTFAFACLLRFYKGTWNGKALPVNDDERVMDNFVRIWSNSDIENVVKQILSIKSYWGQDLTQVTGLIPTMVLVLKEIELHGIEKGYENYARVY